MKIDIPADDEIKQIVQIHILAFPNSFTTKLGSKFLHEYYTAFIKTKDLTILCSKTSDNLISGFICGSSENGLIYKHLIGRLPFIIFPLSFSFFMNIDIAKKIVYKSMMILAKKKANPNVHMNGYNEIYSFAIKPDYSGKNIGSALLSEYIRAHSLEKPIKGIFITTDNNESNSRTLNFYMKNNFLHINDFIQYPNRKMSIYAYSFDK